MTRGGTGGPRSIDSTRPGCSAYYHAVPEEGVPFRDIAEVIGRQLKVPVISKRQDEAAVHFTWFAHFAGMNVSASSQQTAEQLKWQPTMPGLIADLDRPQYFD